MIHCFLCICTNQTFVSVWSQDPECCLTLFWTKHLLNLFCLIYSCLWHVWTIFGKLVAFPTFRTSNYISISTCSGTSSWPIALLSFLLKLPQIFFLYSSTHTSIKIIIPKTTSISSSKIVTSAVLCFSKFPLLKLPL